MSQNKTTFVVGTTAMIIGVAIGVYVSNSENHQEENVNVEKAPLYWVAPMDSNYRRDEPGKSPMGMDLIPVYEESGSDDYGPGVVKISPDVVHNLGVRVSRVKEDVLHSEIKTVGYVKYDEDQLKHIHPRVEGWIEKLYVKAAGDPIKKDEPLYELYSPQLVNAQEEYLLALNRNNQSLITAAENRLKALQLSREFIKRIKQKRKVQQTITFKSPQGGVVDNLNIREGFYVKPGTTLMSIGKLDPVWVEAEIFERQASLVKTGLPVKMTLDYLEGKQWQGHVDYVYPTLDPKTRTLRVRLRFDNRELTLKPNMFAEVKIFTESKERVLLVPKEAVIRTGTHNVVVHALGEGRFKSVAVKLGASDENHIAITEGLLTGDKVVVSAQFLLDSESSKQSDFKRMYHAKDGEKFSEIPRSVWVAVTIESVDKEGRRARIEHAEIPEWARPVMTMNVGFSDDVDISNLDGRSEMPIQLTKQDGGIVLITGIDEMMKPHSKSQQKMNYQESVQKPADHSMHDTDH